MKLAWQKYLPLDSSRKLNVSRSEVFNNWYLLVFGSDSELLLNPLNTSVYLFYQLPHFLRGLKCFGLLFRKWKWNMVAKFYNTTFERVCVCVCVSVCTLTCMHMPDMFTPWYKEYFRLIKKWIIFCRIVQRHWARYTFQQKE